MLSQLTLTTLGSSGAAFLSVLVALACFTTAISIVVGTSDFFKGIFKNSQKAYVVTAAVSSLIGIIMGQFEVKFIIDLAVYILMFTYPITIVLILLNLLPEKFAGPLVFKAVVAIAVLFSITDFLKFLIPVENLEFIYEVVPFSRDALGWVIPSLITFVIVNAFTWNKNKPALS